MLWLTENGYKTHVMWECQFRREIDTNDALKHFMTFDVRLKPPLDPRSAFFGGRTNSIKLYHLCSDPEEKIKYYDINGLYPYINKKSSYPCGHPEIYVGTEIDHNRWQDYFGLIFCRILPPRRLFHPVLPLRINNRLMFVVCYSCAKAKSQGPCLHDVGERTLEGVWTTEEIALAVSKGYQMQDIFEGP